MWQKLGAEYKPVVSATRNQDWQWILLKDTKTTDIVEYFDNSGVDEDKV